MKANLLEADNAAGLSNFRRRNNILIFILFSIILISLALITTTSSYVYLFPQYDSSSELPNPAVESFCSVTGNNRTCFESLDPVSRVLKHPDQVFDHFLNQAAKEIKKASLFLGRVSTMSTSQAAEIKNCSVLLQDVWSQLSWASLKMRTISEELTGEKREEMMNWFIKAEEGLDSCYLEHLVRQEMVVAAGLRESVDGTKMYAGFCRDYLIHYGLVLDRFDDLFMPDTGPDNGPDTYIWIILQDLFEQMANLVHKCIVFGVYVFLRYGFVWCVFVCAAVLNLVFLVFLTWWK